VRGVCEAAVATRVRTCVGAAAMTTAARAGEARRGRAASGEATRVRAARQGEAKAPERRPLRLELTTTRCVPAAEERDIEDASVTLYSLLFVTSCVRVFESSAGTVVPFVPALFVVDVVDRK